VSRICLLRGQAANSLQLTRAANLLLLAIPLAGCGETIANAPTSPSCEPAKLSSTIVPANIARAANENEEREARKAREARAAREAKLAREAKADRAAGRAKADREAEDAKAAREAPTPVKPVNPAADNPALGLKLLGDTQRNILLQDRLRGLCELVKVDQVSADSWRATCAKGGAFVLKIYSDGYISVTRS
jgi:hypothetical protein